MRPQSLVHYFSGSPALCPRSLRSHFSLFCLFGHDFCFLSLLIRLISIWALRRAGAHTMPANYANRDWIMSSAKPQIIIFPNSKVIIIVSGRCGFIDFESLPRFQKLSRRFSDDPRRSAWWNLRMVC